MTAAPMPIGEVFPARTEVQWDHYDRVASGVYRGYCTFARNYRDPSYKRWVCLLRFDLLSENGIDRIATVPMFLNLGTGSKPKAGRRSRYWQEWCKAAGTAPERKDRLGHNVFLHRHVTVQVGETEGVSPYSKVTEIVSWDTGQSFPPRRVESENLKPSLHSTPEASENGASGKTTTHRPRADQKLEIV